MASASRKEGLRLEFLLKGVSGSSLDLSGRGLEDSDVALLLREVVRDVEFLQVHACSSVRETTTAFPCVSFWLCPLLSRLLAFCICPIP